MKYHYEDENVKISIIFPKIKGKLIANATILLKTAGFGIYTTKWFRIWHSPNFNDRLQEPINITPPTLNLPFFPIVTYFENAKQWYEIERLIYSAYLKAVKERDEKKEIVKIDEKSL